MMTSKYQKKNKLNFMYDLHDVDEVNINIIYIAICW